VTCDYTEVNTAEDASGSSNEFITDFMNPDDREDDFGFTNKESIDLI
jgi:hypothetical protein